MEQNLTADQVINMLSGIVETGKTFACRCFFLHRLSETFSAFRVPL